jgi:hypothetical protein
MHLVLTAEYNSCYSSYFERGYDRYVCFFMKAARFKSVSGSNCMLCFISWKMI